MLALGRARPAALAGVSTAVEPTFFSVRAVDDRGAVSEPATRAFFADNVAPEVQITQPSPSLLTITFVPPTIRIRWQGNDPDGKLPSRLAKYKFKLLGPGGEFPIDFAVRDPDSLRRYYAPAFAGWDWCPVSRWA